ncbi:MAG: hypothetical protein ACREQZ_06515 [Woeseiaceae bacterium]
MIAHFQAKPALLTWKAVLYVPGYPELALHRQLAIDYRMPVHHELMFLARGSPDADVPTVIDEKRIDNAPLGVDRAAADQ